MGLLENFNLDDPQTQGLLGLSANFLSAGGFSRTPISFGQALASGFQGYNSGLTNARKAAHENTALQLQNAQLAQALRQGEITSAAYKELLGQLNGGGTPAAVSPTPSAPSSTGQSPQAMPSAGTGTGSGMSSGGGALGLNRSALLGAMIGGPGELGKAVVAANAPTDFTKLLQQAGIDPNSEVGRQFLQQQIAKQNNIPLVAGRAGAPMYNSAGGIVAMAPKIPDNAVPKIENGQVVGVSMLPGAAGVEQMNAYSSAAGKNQAEPIAGVDASGQPTFSNKFAAAGGGMPSPTQGNASSWQIPRGVQAARDNDRLTILQQERANPQNSPQDNAALDREISRTQSVLGASPRGGSPAQQNDTSAALRPSAAPGFNESQTKLAGASADRYIATINQANDSPTRVNVYDNILALSRAGAQTGPTAEWANKVKGYVSSVPGVDSVFPGIKQDVSNYQEIGKFMMQNAQRSWQAAGGTGTDAQLEAFMKSNPNQTLTPQALQAIAEWGKAGELAVQGKANAAQQWKDAHAGDVRAQDQFERVWRNNFDPTLYQLKTMTPQAAAAFVANLKTTNPNGYATLMMKAQALKNNGGL